MNSSTGAFFIGKLREGFYLLFFILFASCATIKTRPYDSSFIKKDSVHIVVKKDNNAIDSIRYYESKVTVSHSPRLFKMNNVWYVILSVVLIAAAVVVRVR
jgi:hypothetical protein